MYPTFAQYESDYDSGRRAGSSRPEAAETVRPLRKQVARACDWCRARRIKCDNGRPCKGCRQRGAECTNKGTDEARTLPQALREIDRLKLRLRELETELDGYKNGREPSVARPFPTPSNTPLSSSTDGALSPAHPHTNGTPSPQHIWRGIFTSTARSDRTAYYGPSSAFFFVHRIGAHLGKSLQQPYAEQTMQPKGINKIVVNPIAAADAEVSEGPAARAAMSRMQEEYFLGLFWESCHCMLPILDEADFRRHYEGLWAGSGYRKQSALVDIVIALCLQYGSTFIPRETQTSGRDPSYNDATIAGRAYYRRCQALLTSELECPSLMTVQCLIFSIIYLCCASFQNMAHVFMAQTIRTAQIIGLHLEPPEDMPLAERELRKRVWWVMYTAETKTVVKLGRPYSIDETQMTVTLPSDSHEVAALSGARLGSYGPEVTWLTYSRQMQKLMLTTMSIFRDLYQKCGALVASRDLAALHKDPQALESCAEFLASRMPALQAWVDEVPADMKIKRRGGEPLSLDKAPLIIETLAPTWLQSHRLGLESMYHTMNINLYRPFIQFGAKGDAYTPISERLAAACVNHAIAHTMLMHKAVSETDLMSGWTESFIWQWNAALTIVGFVLAYPIHPVTPAARKALDKAIDICDIYGANFAVAASGAEILRDLTAKADLLIDRLRTGFMSTTEAETPAHGVEGGGEGVRDPLAWLDPSEQDETFSGFMDWALTVDSFNSFEHFYDTNNVGGSTFGF